jgi:hypothetical protein
LPNVRLEVILFYISNKYTYDKTLRQKSYSRKLDRSKTLPRFNEKNHKKLYEQVRGHYSKVAKRESIEISLLYQRSNLLSVVRIIYLSY